MVKRNYTVPLVQYGKVRKSKTIPDQSMSIKEIVKRFVRGVPVDIQQKQEVYVDQTEFDLEKLSRLDFGEKAEMSELLKAQAAQMQSDHNEAVRRSKEERAKKESEAKAAQAEKKGPEDPSA